MYAAAGLDADAIADAAVKALGGDAAVAGRAWSRFGRRLAPS